MEKKINLEDPVIQIRILKALEDVKPFGVFRCFSMIKIIRNLKQPNIISAKHIWTFLKNEFDSDAYTQKCNLQFTELNCTFDKVFMN